MKTPRLTAKLFRILGLIVLIIIAAHTSIYQFLTRKYLAEQIFLRGETLAQPLWQKAVFSLKVGGNSRSLYGLSHLCNQIKENTPGLSEVSVIDFNGRILAHNDTLSLWKKNEYVPKVKQEKVVFSETASTLDTYLPIYRQKEKPLFVKVSFSKNLLEQQSWKAFWVSLVFSGTVIFIFLLVIYLTANLILGRRIAMLLEGFDSLARGQLNTRLSLEQPDQNPNSKQQDELDLLINSFDQMAGKLEEISKQHEIQEKRLVYLATHDELTGLPNRRLLENYLNQAVNRARKGTESVLLFMDVDNFKSVNDTLGHTAGDKILVSLTDLLKKQVNKKQLLARFGGDEFALLMEKGSNIEEGKKLAEQICRAVQEFRFTLDEGYFYFGLSVGIVPIDGIHDSGALLAHADNAMYTAKNLGRNRYVVYKPGKDSIDRLSRRTEWIARLKEALVHDNFLLYYQPVVDLANNQVIYYEALLRLQKEAGDGLFFPGEFIQIAEDFGLMPQIDRWVVGKVLHTLKEHPGIKIFMNLSASSLADESLINFIEETFQESQIDPVRIGFEITETVAIKDLELTKHWITRLKSKGCQFALDDFGSGFNSFVYLKNLPVDQLKLDGSFIKSLDHEPAQRAFVEAMHQLAHALGVETVAEFVESETVYQILQQIGVNYGQGYFLGRPDPSFNNKSLFEI